MTSAWRQFVLLSWKNWLLQKRKVVVTCLEIGLPTLLIFILLIIRQLVEAEHMTEPTTWPSFPVDELPSNLTPPSDMGLPGGRAKWLLPYAPNHAVVRRVMGDVGGKLDMIVDGLGFATEDDLLEFVQVENQTTQDVWGGVVFTSEFPDEDTLPSPIKYRIRPRSEQTFGRNSRVRFVSASDWYTSYMYPLSMIVGPRQKLEVDGGIPGYNREGFLAIQLALDEALVSELSTTPPPPLEDIAVEMKRHPYPPYANDPFIYVIQNNLPFLIMLSFIVLAPNVVKDVVLEKERKLKEYMKLMGLKAWMNWLAWFIKYLIFALISVLIMVFFMHVNFGNGAILTNTDPSVTLVFLILYVICTIVFCFMISAFFSKASSGAAAGAILFLASYVPYFFVAYQYRDLSLATKIGTSLFHNVAMAYGCVQFALFESRGDGSQWSNIASPVNPSDNFTMVHVWIMLLVDTLIYGLVAWYVDAVKPGNFGISRPFYFPFTKKYWCGTSSDKKGSNELEDIADVDYGANAEYFEPNPTGLTAGIIIRDLTKEFKSGKEKKAAVDGLSLDMFEGQITALLGHNGAGKTTTMFTLTGFLEPTSGTAYVNGYNITTDMEGIRKSLGLCPQHDVLFDTLTVHEHLQFFAELKGCPKSELKREVTEMIATLHLEDKTNALAKSLSGGMKRKLCVGMAFIAGSKVVMLDEPTSGMDPDARRQCWDILQGQREGRTLVLTTHFMDEADYLGDRISIMAEGVVKCVGSSLFLKGKYGVGYHMIMVKEPHCDVPRITEIITKYVPEAELESNISAELSYVLPQDSTAQFEGLFTHLEDNRHQLGISSYGASITTMEEVFLKVGESVDESLQSRLNRTTEQQNGAIQSNGMTPNGSANNLVDMEGGRHTGSSSRQTNDSVDLCTSSTQGDTAAPVLGVPFQKNTGLSLQLQQFRAMFTKRVIHSWRNWPVTLTQLVLPLAFTLVACIVLETFPGPRDPPEIELNLGHFEKPISPYAVYNDSDTDDLAAELGTAYASFMEDHAQVEYVNNIDESNTNMDDYLAEKSDDLEVFVTQHLVAASFVGDRLPEYNKSTLMMGHFQNEAYHSVAICMSSLGNTLMRYFVGGSNEIHASNYPLPRTTSTAAEEEIETSNALAWIISYNVAFGMAFLVGSFILFLIKERVVKSKHIQMASGVNVFNFWMSTFLWDFINYIIPSLLLFAIFAAFGLDSYTDPESVGFVIMVFVWYGISILPVTYILSFVFDIPSSGYVWATVLNIFTGTAAMLVVEILKYPDLDLVEIGEALEWVFFALLPNYCFTRGLQDVFLNHMTIKTCSAVVEGVDMDLDQFCSFLQAFNSTNSCCKENCGGDGGRYCRNFETNYLSVNTPGIGIPIIFMSIHCVLAFFLLFFVESATAKSWYQKIVAGTLAPLEASDDVMALQSKRLAEDSDVRAERARISSTPLSDLQKTDTLIVQELQKYYGPFIAVDRLSVGIPEGECFGLLGVNGAGKTTTFKMLTGDEPVSAGNAWVDGHSIRSDIKEVQRQLGYCPQFDALVDQMTVQETLVMYGRLRGIEEDSLAQVVEGLILGLMLGDHTHKQAKDLSGGNKRKLSTAIALIGDPPIVFLDEPTTGMDPVARRLLWDTLTRVRDSGRTLILTSHSMEECEALCTRMAIMVNGQFRCLGSTQHLKNKFGEGYTLTAKVSSLDPGEQETQTRALMNFVEETFPGCVLKDLHQGYVHYQIPGEGLGWGQLFGVMERAKEEYHIDNYAVGQTTLEQVFINFARSQREPQTVDITCGMKTSSCCRFFCCCGCCRDNTVYPVPEMDPVV